jgi:hypothetical protein
MLPKGDARSDPQRYVQTRSGELREQFLAGRQGFYRIECAWCQKRIGWKRKTAAVPGDTSHGICPACATDLVSKMQALQDSPDNETANARSGARGVVPTQFSKKSPIPTFKGVWSTAMNFVPWLPPDTMPGQSPPQHR